MSRPIVDPSVFNTTRDYFQNETSVFLGQPVGLLDTVNQFNPEFTRLYELMCSLDWSHREFDFSKCMVEFQNAKPEDYARMIRTLAWQWEADSIAAFNLSPLLAPFVTSSEYWKLVTEIQRNEVVHALTYSEIVRTSFESPKKAMASVLAEVDAHRRMETVAKVFRNAQHTGALITLGEIDRNSTAARDAAMMLQSALLCMERGQFMPSFMVTFAYGESDQFVPVAEAVQKICNDELSVHVEAGKEVLRNELSTKEGRASFARIRPTVEVMIREVIDSERSWNQNRLFEGGSEMSGCNAKSVDDWILFAANDLYTCFDIQNPYKVVDKNPVGWMEKWIDINKNQGAIQEKKSGNYLMGGFVKGSGKAFSLEGL